MATKEIIKHRGVFGLLKGYLIKLKNPEARNHLYVFLICLLISFFIWLSIKLSKDYHATVNHPVSYVNVPGDKVLVGDLPEKISLKVLGQGLQLMKVKLKRKTDALQIDISEADLKKETNGNKYFAELPTAWYISQVARQTNYYDNLVDIKPDTLILAFEDLKYKKVPVRHRLEYSMDRQLWLKQPVYSEPDSVVVSGVVSQIDTITNIPTKLRKLGKLSGPVEKRVKLKPPRGKNLEVSHDSVTVTINAERYTEAQIKLPLKVELADTLSLRTFPQEVTVTYWVSLDDYQRIEKDMFQAVVKYRNADSRYLPVEIQRAPAFIKIVQVKPGEVEYIFLK